MGLRAEGFICFSNTHVINMTLGVSLVSILSV